MIRKKVKEKISELLGTDIGLSAFCIGKMHNGASEEFTTMNYWVSEISRYVDGFAYVQSPKIGDEFENLAVFLTRTYEDKYFGALILPGDDQPYGLIQLPDNWLDPVSDEINQLKGFPRRSIFVNEETFVYSAEIEFYSGTISGSFSFVGPGNATRPLMWSLMQNVYDFADIYQEKSISEFIHYETMKQSNFLAYYKYIKEQSD